MSRPATVPETDTEEQVVIACRDLRMLVHDADNMSQIIVALTHPDTVSAIVSPESTH